MSKLDERYGLAQILEYAKANRDLCDTPEETKRWSHVAGLAFGALGEPSLADLARIIAEGLIDQASELIKKV